MEHQCCFAYPLGGRHDDIQAGLVDFIIRLLPYYNMYVILYHVILYHVHIMYKLACLYTIGTSLIK